MSDTDAAATLHPQEVPADAPPRRLPARPLTLAELILLGRALREGLAEQPALMRLTRDASLIGALEHWLARRDLELAA